MTTEEKDQLALLIANVAFALMCSYWGIWCGLLVCVAGYVRMPYRWAFLAVFIDLALLVFIGWYWGMWAGSLYLLFDFAHAYVRGFDFPDDFSPPTFPPLNDN